MSGFRYRPFRTQPRRLSRMYLGRGFVTNNPPTITVPGAQSATSNVAKAISGTSIADADGNTQTVTLTVSHGTMTLASTTGLTFSAGDGTADTTMTLSGSIANINTAIATITYTSTTDYEGPDSLAIATDDGAGGTDSDSIAITVTWNPLSLGSALKLWIDPNSLAYSDAGSTLANAGDLVYQIVCQKTGLVFVQATSGIRPTLRQGANGFKYLECDGARKLVCATPTGLPTGAGARSFFVAASRTAGNTVNYPFSYGVGTNNQTYALDLGDGSTNKVRIVGYFNDWASTFTSGTTWSVYDGYFNGTVTGLRKDAATEQTNTPTAFNTTLGSAYIGSFTDGGNYHKGNIGDIVVTNTVLSAGQRALLYTFVSGRLPT